MKPTLPSSPIRKAFSLVELLVVVALLGVLSLLATMAFNSITRGQGVTKAGYDIAEVMNVARSHAMANNTYTWVGFLPQSNEGLRMTVVASKNGNGTPTNTDLSSTNSELTQIWKTALLQNIALITAPNSPSNRPAVSANAQLAANTTAILPFSTGTGAGKLNYNRYVVQFNSRGEARIASGALKNRMEVGVGPFNATNIDNYAAIQISALTGSVTVYRP
jgi:prepilin-type N-terminal cleavage/methylation domain-containing protein